jgi:hypothetical protein
VIVMLLWPSQRETSRRAPDLVWLSRSFAGFGGFTVRERLILLVR